MASLDQAASGRPKKPDTSNTFELRLKLKGRYRGIRREQFYVKEVGRFYGWQQVELETWSTQSGEQIPDACVVPVVRVPTTLPLSLYMEKYDDDRIDSEKYPDYTDPNRGYKVRTETVLQGHSRDMAAILAWSARESYSLSAVDFVINCMNLRRVSLTTMKPEEPWSIAVYSYKGVIFLDNNTFQSLVVEPGLESDDETTEDFIQTLRLGLEVDPQITYTDEYFQEQNYFMYGKKFEDVMKSGGPGDVSYAGEDVDVRGVREVKIGTHLLLTSARISCQEPEGELDTLGNYVEIKTVSPLHEGKAYWFERYKSLQLWTHCALVGIDAVYCGHSNRSGQLLEIKRYTMDDLADFGCRHWYPGEMPSFLNTLLGWVKERVVEGQTYTLTHKGDGLVKLKTAEHPDVRVKVEEGLNML